MGYSGTVSSLPATPSSLRVRLDDRVRAATGIDPELRPATKPQFGHFQSNVALRLAKSEGRPPRELAAEIIERLDVDDLCEPPEIAGPGFINLRLKASTLAAAVTAQLSDPQLGLATTEVPQRVVIDYSHPNVAKQMHVGHLRTTIIGDCFNRVLTALGHTVVAQNHIGDWGTQFGMLVEQILDEQIDAATLTLPSAADLYARAQNHFRSEPAFADAARARVVALQSGDPRTRTIWQQLIDISLAGFNDNYARLNVLLTDDDLAGESIYNDDLPVVAADLEQQGVAVIDDGALCVFVDGYNAPMIVRKRDGGFGYDATDLAAIRHRVSDLKAERLIYVTDARQADHFGMIFAVCRKAGYLPDGVSAEHVGYGLVLGTDGKPFKTREGKAVPLTVLLDAAEERASAPVALAAIKYADLSNTLNRDYVFDVDRMVASTGNTGPYLQYAHARMCQVLRKAEADGISVAEQVQVLTEPAEQTLALQLTGFGTAVADVAETLQPHRLCAYLYDTAVALSTFYEQCPVLKSEGEVQASRLALCVASQRVLARGLDLLGIPAPDRM